MLKKFGDFVLDAQRGHLQGPQGPLAMRGYPMRVLVLLVERAPQVVSQDEIISIVWGHDALSDSALPQVIKEIRKALGDSARNPEYVATEYGRGYRLVAPVTEVEQEASNVRRNAAMAIALMLVLALGWVWLSDTNPDVITPAQAEPWVLQAVESNDGDSLARPFAAYLTFVAQSSVGSERLRMARPDEDLSNARRIQIGLETLGDERNRSFRTVFNTDSHPEATSSTVYQEAQTLMASSLEQIFRAIDLDVETRIDAGLVSTSAYATETLLRGMAAQFAGELDRAVRFFEVCLEEDQNFDFARYELAIAVRRQGNYERALGLLESLQRRHTSDFWVHRLANAKGIAHWRLGQYDQAAANLYEARKTASRSATRGIVGVNLGLVLRDDNQLDAALQAIEQAIVDAQQADNSILHAATLNTLASIRMRTGDLEAALEPLSLARELFFEAGHRDAYARVLSRTAKVHHRLGHWQQAESLHRLALGVREQLGNSLDTAASGLSVAELARQRGDFRAARKLELAALDDILAYEDVGMKIKAYLALAKTALAARRAEDSSNYAAQAQRLADASGDTDDQIRVALQQLRIALERNPEKKEALVLLEQANSLLSRTQDTDRRDDDLQARWLVARAAEAAGSLSAAQAAWQTMLSEAKAQGEASLALEAALGLTGWALKADAASALDHVMTAEAFNPPPYPFLRLKAQALASANRYQDALAAALESRAQAGDWWNDADEALVQRLETMLESTSATATGELQPVLAL